MTSEEQKIIDIKVRYEDAIYGIIRFQEKLNDLKKTQQQMDEALEKGTISWNEWATQTEAATAATKQYKDNIRVLRKEMQNNLKTEQEQEGSLKSLRAQLSNATKAYDELSRAERNGAKGAELRNHIEQITNELKRAEEETQRYYRNVGNYYNSVVDAAMDVKNTMGEFMLDEGVVGEYIGGIAQMGAATENLGVKVKALGKSLMTLMTNPVFLAIAGIAGAGMAFKFWFDYNKGLMEASRLTEEFTGRTGADMQALRDRILALSNAIGSDFKETLSTVDFLMAQFGISAEEATKVVQDGFAAGANLSGDMLKNLTKYAPAFKDMGLSAEELAAVLSQTRSGIFTEAGMDAIVMAGKKLREMSTTTSEALKNVGIDAERLQQQMTDGEITGFEAIQKVSAALAKVGTNSREAGQVMLNVFGRNATAAGEQLLKSLATMSTSIEEAKETTGEWGKQQEQLIAASEDLKNVTAALFDVTDNGFEGIINQAKIIATESLTGMMKGVVKLINYFIELYNKSTAVRGGLELMALNFKTVYAIAKGAIKLIIDGFKGMGRQLKGFLQILEGVLTFDLEKARQGFNSMFSGFKDTVSEQWGDLKQVGVDIWDAVKTGWNNSVNGNELKPIEIPQMGGYNGTSGGNGTTTPSTTKTQPQGKETTKTTTKTTADEQKRAAEEQKRREKELQAAILQIQMQYQSRMIEAKKMYLAGLYESDEQYQTDIETIQKEEIARMLDVYVQAGAIGEQKAQEMQQKLLDMAIKFKEQLKRNAATTVEEWRKEFDAAETAAKRSALDSGQLPDEDEEGRLNRYLDFLEKKKAAFAGSNEQLAALDAEYKQAEADRDEAAYEKKKNTLNLTLKQAETVAQTITQSFQNAFAEMFAEEEVSFKAFLKGMLSTLLDAIEKALIAQQAAILARELASKSWAGVASAAGLTALITAAFEAAKVAVKGFAVGGYVQGAGTGTSDSIPARLSNGESVMTARTTSMFSPLLSAFNQLGGGVPINAPTAGTQIGEDFLAAAVAKGFQMCPAPVVSVKEITSVQSRIRTIENRGTM